MNHRHTAHSKDTPYGWVVVGVSLAMASFSFGAVTFVPILMRARPGSNNGERSATISATSAADGSGVRCLDLLNRTGPYSGDSIDLKGEFAAKTTCRLSAPVVYQFGYGIKCEDVSVRSRGEMRPFKQRKRRVGFSHRVLHTLDGIIVCPAQIDGLEPADHHGPYVTDPFGHRLGQAFAAGGKGHAQANFFAVRQGRAVKREHCPKARAAGCVEGIDGVAFSAELGLVSVNEGLGQIVLGGKMVMKQ